MTANNGYVFISFKSEEIDKAKEIQQYLEKEGYKCWRAPESLHNRGTQDYGNDIFEAIRNSACLFFVLSNRALCSDWVRKEVKYALEKCHKPIVPYVIDKIPAVKYDSDELMISLSLQKQILNEDLSNDYSVILSYLKQCVIQEEVGESHKDLFSSFKISEAEFDLLLSEADFWLEKVYAKLPTKGLKVSDNDTGMAQKSSDPIRELDAYLQSLPAAVNSAAVNLTSALCAIMGGFVEDKISKTAEIRASLFRLTFEKGKWFNQDLFSLVEPFAENGAPWACFMLSFRYYNPNAGQVSDNDTGQMAYRLLSNAVKDVDNPYAAILMGTCLQWGIGCRVSGIRALFWYNRALGLDEASQTVKCPTAYAYLGRLYDLHPVGIAHDEEMVEYYYKKGTEAHDMYAYYRYGDFWLDKKDMKVAAQDYFKAYALGSLPALAWLAYLVDDEEELAAVYNSKCLSQIITQVDYSQFKQISAMQAMAAFGDSKNKAGSVISYATSGILQKDPTCAQILGGVLIALNEINCEEALDSGSAGTTELLEFFTHELKGDDHAQATFIMKALECARKDEFRRANAPSSVSGYYSNASFPASPFWHALMTAHANEGPSCVRDYERFTPYKLLEAIRECSVPSGSALHTVKKAWAILRDLDFEKYDTDQIDAGYFSCVTQSNGVYGRERLLHFLDMIESLLDLVPELRIKWSQRMQDMKRTHCAVEHTSTPSEVNEIIHGYLADLFSDIEEVKSNSLELRIACRLNCAEKRISPPVFAVALDYFRLSYIWGSSTDSIHKMASLFLVNNGRLRDIHRTEGFIYLIRAALEKSIYMGEIDGVPLFLEMAMFGATVGQARVESNFESISEVDSTLFDLTLYDNNGADISKDLRKLEIAYAMMKIYLDKGLYDNARCEQKWGVASLYNPAKAVQWLARTSQLINNIMRQYKLYDSSCLNMTDEMVIANIKGIYREISCLRDELVKQGFRDTGEMDSIRQGSCDSNSERNMDECEKDEPPCLARIQKLDKKWVDKVKQAVNDINSQNPNLVLSFFPHVKLGEDTVHSVVSDDSTAIMLCQLPGDLDCEIRAKSGYECHYGVPEMAPGIVSLDFVTTLENIGSTLKRLEPDSTVELGIVANNKTCENLEEQLRLLGLDEAIHLFCYEHLADQLAEIYR